MSTTYLSQAVRDQLDQAQQVINKHIVDCAACGSARLCYDRIEAERVFLRYNKLPHRTPGLTGAGATELGSFGWLAS